MANWFEILLLLFAPPFRSSQLWLLSGPPAMFASSMRERLIDSTVVCFKPLPTRPRTIRFLVFEEVETVEPELGSGWLPSMLIF